MKTRARLLTTASEVFNERGYNRASVTEIAARANSTPGALYHHFSSKAGLAEGILAVDLTEGVEHDPEVPALQEWIDLGLLLTQRVQADPQVKAALQLAALDRPTRTWASPWELWRTTVSCPLIRAEQGGELLPGVELSAVVSLFMTNWVGGESLTSADEHAVKSLMNNFFTYTLPGVATPAVLARLDYSPERGLLLRERIGLDDASRDTVLLSA
ncbi:helix-turn-helix domain-containing protein [Streptomyces sp. NPDC052496]|uniref:helix-turn-helix domain-containing protein n=1 Tax=Streptomyces sp. NPDC052496 TaxID=3154951 RepID=UPI003425789C